MEEVAARLVLREGQEDVGVVLVYSEQEQMGPQEVLLEQTEEMAVHKLMSTEQAGVVTERVLVDGVELCVTKIMLLLLQAKQLPLLWIAQQLLFAGELFASSGAQDVRIPQLTHRTCK